MRVRGKTYQGKKGCACRRRDGRPLAGDFDGLVITTAMLIYAAVETVALDLTRRIFRPEAGRLHLPCGLRCSARCAGKRL